MLHTFEDNIMQSIADGSLDTLLKQILNDKPHVPIFPVPEPRGLHSDPTFEPTNRKPPLLS